MNSNPNPDPRPDPNHKHNPNHNPYLNPNQNHNPNIKKYCMSMTEYHTPMTEEYHRIMMEKHATMISAPNSKYHELMEDYLALIASIAITVVIVNIDTIGTKVAIVAKVAISNVELWDIKFISTSFWTTTDLLAQTISLMDIFEPSQFFGGGSFGNMYLQI